MIRINGHAVLRVDEDLTGRFETAGKTPKSVIVATVSEVYFQCAKALMRSELWSDKDMRSLLPTAGDFIREFTEGFDGKAYDEGYGAYAKDRMW